MRSLNREAWFLNYVISFPHFENTVQACEDFADLFNRLLTGYGIHGEARLDYWVSCYLQHAQAIQRDIEFARSGDYLPIWGEMDETARDYRGLVEQPLGWMNPREKQAFEDAFDRLGSYCDITKQALANAFNSGRRWLERETLDLGIVNRDEGFKGDYEEYFVGLRKEGVVPTLQSYPTYRPDTSRSCRAGETCPWTGVWIPQQVLDEGLQDFSLALALEGRPMQPAFRIKMTPSFLCRDENDEGLFPYMEPVTTAEDALWYPLLPERAATLPEVIPAHRGRCEANQACPRAGYWWTLAREGSRRHFDQGEMMPDYPNSQYGQTIWMWDQNQEAQ